MHAADLIHEASNAIALGTSVQVIHYAILYYLKIILLVLPLGLGSFSFDLLQSLHAGYKVRSARTSNIV